MKIICPTLMTFIFFFNMFSMKFERKVHLTTKRRQEAVTQKGLGAWNYVLWYLGYFTITANCIFMSWLREDLAIIVIDRIHVFDSFFPAAI